MHHFNRIRFCRIIEELAISLKPSERKIITSAPEERSILGVKSHLVGEFRRISLSRVRRSGAELLIRTFFSSRERRMNRQSSSQIIRREVDPRWWTLMRERLRDRARRVLQNELFAVR